MLEQILDKVFYIKMGSDSDYDYRQEKNQLWFYGYFLASIMLTAYIANGTNSVEALFFMALGLYYSMTQFYWFVRITNKLKVSKDVKQRK